MGRFLLVRADDGPVPAPVVLGEVVEDLGLKGGVHGSLLLRISRQSRMLAMMSLIRKYRNTAQAPKKITPKMMCAQRGSVFISLPMNHGALLHFS